MNEMEKWRKIWLFIGTLCWLKDNLSRNALTLQRVNHVLFNQGDFSVMIALHLSAFMCFQVSLLTHSLSVVCLGRAWLWLWHPWLLVASFSWSGLWRLLGGRECWQQCPNELWIWCCWRCSFLWRHRRLFFQGRIWLQPYLGSSRCESKLGFRFGWSFLFWIRWRLRFGRV